MDLTLPDLNGMVRDMLGAEAKHIPLEWLNQSRFSLPIGTIFGMTEDGPRLVVVFLNSQPHWALLREQFPSLQKVDRVGHYAMSEADFTKMRLIFGGEW